MPPLPSGTVTFLFTDIEGSTPLWEQHPDAMRGAVARHHTFLRESIEAHGGHVFTIAGDAFCAAFATASDVLGAALDAQRSLHQAAWGEGRALTMEQAVAEVQHAAAGDKPTGLDSPVETR